MHIDDEQTTVIRNAVERVHLLCRFRRNRDFIVSSWRFTRILVLILNRVPLIWLWWPNSFSVLVQPLVTSFPFKRVFPLRSTLVFLFWHASWNWDLNILQRHFCRFNPTFDNAKARYARGSFFLRYYSISEQINCPYLFLSAHAKNNMLHSCCCSIAILNSCFSLKELCTKGMTIWSCNWSNL